MSLLPERFLKSIVSIKNNSNTLWTGFLYWIKLEKTDPITKRNHYSFFLVTNKHIANINTQLTIVFNKINGGITTGLITDSNSWVIPTDDIDIAILQLNYDFLIQNEVEYSILKDEDSILNKIDFLNLKVGTDVFLAWFPLWITWLEKNYPIARQWIIARNDDELIKKWQFYLDINNFPWNSWWPIFLRPSLISLEWLTPINKSLVIWVICAYLPFNRTLYDTSSHPHTPMMITQENSWIAIWVPIYIAYELAKKLLESQWEKIFNLID